MSLFWRVYLLNAALVVAAGVTLALSPATISTPVKVVEEAVLGLAIILLLAVNFMLLRPNFRPLESAPLVQLHSGPSGSVTGLEPAGVVVRRLPIHCGMPRGTIPHC